MQKILTRSAETSLKWQWATFNEMSSQELYAALALRARVFVVEQNCVYQDCDGIDTHCHHLLGWSLENRDGNEKRKLMAYLRVVPAGLKYAELSLGRVVTAPEARGFGIGKELMVECLKRIDETYGPAPIRISAQAYLEKFYSHFGFQSVGELYDEDGIPHIEMLKPGGLDPLHTT